MKTDALGGDGFGRGGASGREKPDEVSHGAAPHARFSFPGVCPRGLLSQRAGRSPRARTVRAPGLFGVASQDRRTSLTVGPTWTRLSPFMHELLLLHPTTAGQGELSRGCARRPTCRAQERKTPHPPGRQPVSLSRNGLSISPDNERWLAFQPETMALSSPTGRMRRRSCACPGHPEKQEKVAWDPPPQASVEGPRPGATGRSPRAERTPVSSATAANCPQGRPEASQSQKLKGKDGGSDGSRTRRFVFKPGRDEGSWGPFVGHNGVSAGPALAGPGCSAAVRSCFPGPSPGRAGARGS